MPELPTLWVPYVWVISAVLLLIGVVIAVIWGFRKGQFDEKIKYQMFEELDDDMYLDEGEQDLAMRQKKLTREARLRREADEENAEAGKPGGDGGASGQA
ncbi:MAG: cbb3-type cytochrome oxidase assembly protein CcoS [Nitrospirae bacterium]|nr:cbb3-type cytochrome oxidase assembly protein CcoS [Nitrospirota bacterium]